MKWPATLSRKTWLVIFFAILPQVGNALELSEASLAIVTQDSIAPATGTLTLLGLSTELPPGAQTVAGLYSAGDVVLRVRASLSSGSLFSLTGVVEESHSPTGAGDFCCIGATGYTPESERIPGPDEFWPWIWNWFFDATADPGLLAAGETVDLWVSFTQLQPGDQIHFFASGPGPIPCGTSGCDPFGTTTVLAGAVPLLDFPGVLLLTLLLSASVLTLGNRFKKSAQD